MDKEIQEIIERQLPAQVGEVLRKRLEQAESDAKTVEQQKATIGYRDAEIKTLSSRVLKLEVILQKHTELDARELAVEKRERNIELDIAKMRADNAEQNRDDIFNLVSLVFKNSSVKESVIRNEQVPVQPGVPYPQFVHQSSNATTTREVE